VVAPQPQEFITLGLIERLRRTLHGRSGAEKSWPLGEVFRFLTHA